MLIALRSWISLAFAVATLFLALWIFLPAPTYFLLTFGVGAPEVSAWLILSALFGIALAWPARTRTIARIAITCFMLALVLAATPFARFPATAHRFDDAMRAGLGDDPLRNVPDSVRRIMRPHPLVFLDLFTGISLGRCRELRALPIASPAGTPLTMNVYMPMARGQYPIVVQIYGGAWQRGDPDSYTNFAQYLASRGYVVFAIDYRHAPAAHWPAQRQDVDTALAWIAAHATSYDADTSRVALLGRSAGAHLAMMAAYTPAPLRIRAVISLYGPADLTDAYAHPPHPDPLHIRDVEEKFIGGTPSEMPEAYRDASPITYATRPLPPTLLIYGGRDHIVEPRYGSRLATQLTGTGTTAIFLEIPWAEHAFDAVFAGPSSQLALFHMERFLAWALATPPETPVQ